MKRTLFGGLTLLVVALVATIGFAQSRDRADVPFAFSVGDKVLAQGSYTLSEVSDHVIQIRNNATNACVTIVAQRKESKKAQAARLVFREYGDSYFLAEAWTGAGGDGIEFPARNQEKETRTASARTGGVTDVVIALR